MKNIAIILITFSIVIACKSNYKNETLRISIDDFGLSTEEVQLFQNQIPNYNSQFNFGNEITLAIKNIKGLTTTDNNRVVFGGEVSVIDTSNNVLFHVADYFKNYELNGFDPEDAKLIKFNLKLGKPLESGQEYRYLFRIWDKKSKKELKGNMQFNIL